MSSVLKQNRLSHEDYFALEQREDQRYEYIAGDIFAMAGGSESHALISSNILVGLSNALRGKPCRVYGADMKLYIRDYDKFCYPDVQVLCEKGIRHDRYVENPIIIVEVLSESTESYDRGLKFEYYRSIESLQYYLLVDQTRQHVDLYERLSLKHWQLSSPQDQLVFSDLSIVLDMEEIYRQVEFSGGDPMTNDANTKRNPYINLQGQHELCKSITAFVDILGFKQLVKNAKEENNSEKLFMDFHRVLSTWFYHIENFSANVFEMPFVGGRKDSFKIRIFTDCILIGCPVREKERNSRFTEGCDELWEVLSLLYVFQLEMTNNGYFVRGAIAVDELYMDDVIIYGNGIIEAYEAEAKKAKYPRIILTQSAEDMLAEIDKGFADENYSNYITSFLCKDCDGQIFLNYLESVKIGDDPYQFVDELKKHKDMIESKLIKHRNEPHYLEKYIWTANYHNYFCKNAYDEYSIDLAQYEMQPTLGFCSV